jgi:hypothetical protein
MRGVLTKMVSLIWGSVGSLKPNEQGTKGGWPCYNIQGNTNQLLLNTLAPVSSLNIFSTSPMPYAIMGHMDWIWLKKCNPIMYNQCTLEHNLHSSPHLPPPSPPILRFPTCNVYQHVNSRLKWNGRMMKQFKKWEALMFWLICMHWVLVSWDANICLCSSRTNARLLQSLSFLWKTFRRHKRFVSQNKIEKNNIQKLVALLKILPFATRPYAITCKQMSHAITNGCLCNYFSNLDEVWFFFQLGCDYDLFHP